MLDRPLPADLILPVQSPLLDWPETGQVHVWSVYIPRLLPWVDQLAPVLAPAERLQAERYRRDRDRVQYIVARGLLRRLLAAYLNMDAAQVSFSYGKNGKPYLAMPSARDLSFNLSHSADMVVYAFAYKHAIGVDVEYMQAQSDLQALAQYVMCKTEFERFRALAPDEQLAAFYRLWTRKEAYIKAIGTGLALPPNEIEVSIVGEIQPRLIHAPEDNDPGRWHFSNLDVPSSYGGALVVDMDSCVVSYRSILGMEDRSFHWSIHRNIG